MIDGFLGTLVANRYAVVLNWFRHLKISEHGVLCHSSLETASFLHISFCHALPIMFIRMSALELWILCNGVLIIVMTFCLFTSNRKSKLCRD